MDITLHWHATSGKHRAMTDSALPFKKQVGHQSNVLDTQIKLEGLSKKINLKWKENLTRLLSGTRFRSDTPCVVYAGTYRFQISGQRTAKDMANRIANLILHARKDISQNANGLANAGKSLKKLLASA